jgi:hypothetical protein
MKPFFTSNTNTHLLTVCILAKALTFSLPFLELLESTTKRELEERKDTSQVPTRVVPANIFFLLKENRKGISEKNRHLDSNGVAKKCQEEWNALDHAGRKKYTDLHAEDKKRHAKETVAYLNSKDENEGNEGA